MVDMYVYTLKMLINFHKWTFYVHTFLNSQSVNFF